MPSDLTDSNRDKTFGPQPATLSAAIYARLRQDIVDGALPPGDKLRIDSVCSRYGATATPVREALGQLASEGFVLRREQRGFTVAEASDAELRELTDTRCWVEGLALRQAILHATDAWEEGIVLAFHRLSRIPRSTDDQVFRENPAWEGAHRSFHGALIATCPSRYLIEFCRQMGDHATRYRRLAMGAVFPHRDVASEHRAIIEATLNRDADRAVAALESHYRCTAGIVRQAGIDPSLSNIKPARKR